MIYYTYACISCHAYFSSKIASFIESKVVGLIKLWDKTRIFFKINQEILMAVLFVRTLVGSIYLFEVRTEARPATVLVASL